MNKTFKIIVFSRFEGIRKIIRQASKGLNVPYLVDTNDKNVVIQELKTRSIDVFFL